MMPFLDVVLKDFMEKYEKEWLFLVKTNKVAKLIYKNKAPIYMSKCFH